MTNRMKPNHRKSERIRIRKCGFEELYLNRQGRWVDHKEAAIFASQDAAEKFAADHNLGNYYGLF